MPYALLIGITFIFALQVIRAKRLSTSALWLAGVSSLLSVLFYLYGAQRAAVIELSVGAGLVTVLFVFAIGIAGEDAMNSQSIVPKPLALGLVAICLGLIGWAIFPAVPQEAVLQGEAPLAEVLWEQRGLDAFVQIVLIFSGVLGLLGLLAEVKAPLAGSMAEEIIARREQDLQNMQSQAYLSAQKRTPQGDMR